MPRHGYALLLLAALLLAAGTAAGLSRASPEVVDATGDGFDRRAAVAAEAGALDLVAAWFEPAEEAVDLHWRVRDLGAFRPQTTVREWRASFEERGVTWEVRATQPAQGAATAVLSARGTTATGLPALPAPSFDASTDEIVVRLPASFTATVGGASRATDLAGATLLALRVQSLDGTGLGDCASAGCAVVDEAGPGLPHSVRDGRPREPRVSFDVPQTLVRGAPGARLPLEVVATSTAPVALEVPLSASVARAGWTVEPTSLPLLVPAGGTTRTTLTVVVPLDAVRGDAAVVRILGAEFPVAAVAAAGADAPVPDLLAPAPAAAGDVVVRPWPLHLQGATQGPAGEQPVAAGRLVAASPTGTGADGATVTFDSAGRRAFGAWRSEPLEASTNLTGGQRVDAYLTWTGGSGLKVRALVGRDPLPLDWSGTDAPAGAVALEAAPTGQASSGATPAQIVLEGTSQGLRLSRGERLAVALFVEGPASATATLHAFGEAAPSRLLARVEEPTFPRPAPRPAPGSGAAAFVASYSSTAGLAQFTDLSASISRAGAAATPLVVSLTPQTETHGTAADRALAPSPAGGAFAAAFDGGERRAHSFTVSGAAAGLSVLLVGDHAPSRLDDHDLDLELWRVVDGSKRLVKTAAGPGPVEGLNLTWEELERHGRGAYEAVVVFDRPGGGGAGTTVSYTVRASEEGREVAPRARLAGAFLWPHAGVDVGDYSLSVTLADGRADPRRVDATYRLTPLGPTMPPVADFAFSPSEPVSGEPVAFADRSADPDGTILSRRWDFGDGANASVTSPTHAFPRPGRYDVRLVVTDDLGATASATRSITVGNAPPVADFRIEPTVATVGASVRFVDLSSDADGTIADRLWAFGDGTGSSLASPEHAYAAAGTYNVSLTVFDAPLARPGGSTFVRQLVVLEPGATADRPVADFDAPINPVAGRAVRFFDRSTWTEGPLVRAWDFGDGNTSAERDPVHTYRDPGEFVVVLTVHPETRPELTASATRPLSVAAPGGLAPAFRVEPARPSTGAPVVLRDATAAAPGLTRQWTFGDGTGARGDVVEHVYRRPGEFTVTLSLVGPDGAEASVSDVVRVERGAAAAVQPPDGATPGTVALQRAHYAAGLEHLEAYTEAWGRREVAGGESGEYLASGARAAYLTGAIPATPSSARAQGGGLLATNPVGARTSLLAGDAVLELGGARVEAPRPTEAFLADRPIDLAGLAGGSPEDDLDDGLLLAESVLEGGGVRVHRSLTLLEGTIHTDLRTTITADRSEPMRLVTEVRLPARPGSWLATPDGESVRAMPAEGADGLTFPLGGRTNRWFAVYAPTSTDVAGVVLAGDVTSVDVARDGSDVVLRVDHVGLGRVRAAEYLVAYRVADPDATRYAGVAELARQDAREVGVAFLDEGRAAAVAWASSDADLSVSTSQGFESFVDSALGRGRLWAIAADAPASNGGKSLRLVMPAGLLDRGLEVALDGATLGAFDYTAAADDATLVVEVPVPHFSLRTVTVRAGGGGVSPVWVGVAFLLAATAGAEAYLLARRRVVRGSGYPPPEAGPEAGLEPVALDETPPEPPAELDDAEVKEALLRRLKGT